MMFERLPRLSASLFALSCIPTLGACGGQEFDDLDYDPSAGCRLVEREARILVEVSRQGSVGDIQIEVYEGSTVSCGPLGASVSTPGEQVDSFLLESSEFERRYLVNFVPPVVPSSGGGETNSKQDAEPDISAKAFTIIGFADVNGNGLCDGREAAGSVSVTPAVPSILLLDRICPIGRL
ncbi:MAG: hypothetical protein ACI81R_003523 [Bradymonadia bacterium]|jgi:hypothetical protein